MINFQVLVYQCGAPESVVRLESRPLESLRPDQVMIAMEAAPINPADFNVIAGNYGSKTPLPFIPGNEGVGSIITIGDQVTDLKVGQRVIFIAYPGTWCRYRICAPRHLYPVPPDMAITQAAMIAVNPATAWRLLHDFAKLKPGDWVIQNAANSAVGRLVIRIAREIGLKTINLVRRQDLAAELQEIGADVVFVQDEPGVKEFIKTEIGEIEIKLGLNAVGGSHAGAIAAMLAPGASLITYGAMSREPMVIPNGQLIFRDIRFQGFWLTRWYQHASPQTISSMFDRLLPLFSSKSPIIPIEKIYPLAEIKAALHHAQQPARSGKILLDLKEVR